MAAFGRGTLAAALATAMAVAPSFAQESARVAAKPANEPKITQPEGKSDVITLADDYSEAHPVVAIGIMKGRKDQISGEKIGDTLSDVLMKAYSGIPSKYFVAPGGDYTAIIFAVKGHIYGPYGLKESLTGIGLAAASYNDVIRPKLRVAPGTASGVAGKPEPQQ